jgi:hypothetical protein
MAGEGREATEESIKYEKNMNGKLVLLNTDMQIFVDKYLLTRVHAFC